MFNFPNVLPKVDYDVVEETVDGVVTTKKVLYKKDGTEIVFSTTSVNLDDEVAKIEAQISALQDQKDTLVQTAQKMNINLTK